MRTKSLASANQIEDDHLFFQGNRITLVVSAGPSAGSEFEIERPSVSIGRGAGADLSFDDEAMSSEHATFELVGGRFRIRDLASTNGVRVNGAVVQTADLKHGDRIQLGTSEFRFLQENARREPKTFVLADDAS